MTTIHLQQLTKSYGDKLAVDHLDAVAHPGRVTAFLGQNGSGKTTTMRVLVGLARATSGSASFDGVAYRDITHPARRIGVVLDPDSFHPRRTARNHLRLVAGGSAISFDRVDIVLDQVGLNESARTNVGGFSLGMRQRLALATALLGDPEVLVLDEPLNGLDPAGIHWMRDVLGLFARRGGTVLLSSHLLAEIAVVADDAIVIERGRLVASGSVASIFGSSHDLEASFLALIASAQTDRDRSSAAPSSTTNDRNPS
jgi:ABC-2 type transport system ATP-binding protein